MKQFRILILMVVLISSIVLLVNFLFASQPVQIILESGEEISAQNNVFSITEVLVMVVSSFLIGLTSAMIYSISGAEELLRMIKIKKEQKPDFSQVLGLLKKDERKVFEELINSEGKILQNALVLKTGLSKVKITRILSRLETKNLVVRERYGLTNVVKVK